MHTLVGVGHADCELLARTNAKWGKKILINKWIQKKNVFISKIKSKRRIKVLKSYIKINMKNQKWSVKTKDEKPYRLTST